LKELNSCFHFGWRCYFEVGWEGWQIEGGWHTEVGWQRIAVIGFGLVGHIVFGWVGHTGRVVRHRKAVVVGHTGPVVGHRRLVEVGHRKPRVALAVGPEVGRQWSSRWLGFFAQVGSRRTVRLFVGGSYRLWLLVWLGGRIRSRVRFVGSQCRLFRPGRSWFVRRFGTRWRFWWRARTRSSVGGLVRYTGARRALGRSWPGVRSRCRSFGSGCSRCTIGSAVGVVGTRWWARTPLSVEAALLTAQEGFRGTKLAVATLSSVGTLAVEKLWVETPYSG